MDPHQIQRARKEKRLYLAAFLIMLILVLILLVFRNRIAGSENAKLVLRIAGYGWTVFAMVVTWRFCRSIGIGKALSAVNVVLSPFFFIIQFIVLLRIYAKKTGSHLTFSMGDRFPDV